MLYSVTVFSDLLADADESLVQIINELLVVFDEPQFLPSIVLAVLMVIFRDPREQCPLFVVVICTIVVFDLEVGSLHVIVDELSLEFKRLFCYNVGPLPEWFLHLPLLLCQGSILLQIALVKGIITSSPLGPLRKFNQFFDLLGCFIAFHF